MKLLEGGHGPRNSRLDFDGDLYHHLDPRFLDHDPDPGIFVKDSSFTVVIYKQPRIKHENPRRSFELSECFLVNLLTLFVWCTA